MSGRESEEEEENKNSSCDSYMYGPLLSITTITAIMHE